ncbi:MAG: cytochrome c biosis protein CcmG, thiol:disulfide interchange protein DsbE [Actinomycetota bacterium]|nr:cytochrome c biosis protein CcmG, thiol:disulfide interchange protein DsbE [Actinomycetota bacterium]
MVDQLDAAGTPGTATPKTLSPKVRRRLRVLAFIVVPALFMGVLAVGLIRTEAPKVRQGAVAPDFSLPTVGGGTLSSSGLKGAPVVINFWASWCDPCNQEAPDLQATWKQYEAKGVRVVGVDYEDRPVDAQAFVGKYGITYPSVVDTGGELATKFGVRGVPETFFVDAQFRFFSIGQGQEQGSRFGTRILGAVSRPQLKSQIDAMLAAASSSNPGSHSGSAGGT